MEALRGLAAALTIVLASAAAFAQSESLFAQAAQAALSKASLSVVASRVSWLVLDAHTGQLLASQWPDADRPIPVGSLTKPFVALAYARTHREYPHYTCAGTATRCWLPKGHGTLSLEEALAFSCNSYFLRLAAETSPAAILEVASNYSLPAPPDANAPAQLIGLDSSWRISPVALGRAYVRLAIQPGNTFLLAGMRRSGAVGTARALASEDVLAKTGTAHCLDDCAATGDGFVVALTPRDDPRLLLLVRQRGTNGASTAATAAQMLNSLRDNHVIER